MIITLGVGRIPRLATAHKRPIRTIPKVRIYACSKQKARADNGTNRRDLGHHQYNRAGDWNLQQAPLSKKEAKASFFIYLYNILRNR